jgi:hypothetical protein
MSVGNFFSPGGAVRAVGVGASLLGLTLLSLLLAGMLTLGWVGYLASDDNAYIGRAEEWLSSSPSLPHDHWSTRHPSLYPSQPLIVYSGLVSFRQSFHRFCLAVLLSSLPSSQLYLALACRQD